ncbi:MAG: PDC sensor domain-containing protein [Paracoccaceae bacterium]|nr:PDC sensor domain-containing protein [Paracoccaceae bacterium]
MKPFLSALAVVCATTPAFADEFAPALESFLETEINGWSQSDAIVAAIVAQNALTSGYDQSRIDELDATWRAEVGMADTPLIADVLNNATSEYLRERVEAAGGQITEVFVMDAQGLNVAASSVTSDYWQGDEAKFQKTYGMGAGASHIGDVEFDESTQTYQGQISVTITDPATGQPIGAMTVGVDAEALM